MIDVVNDGRVRVLRLDRPESKNAFNEALYDLLTEALIEADDDNGVAVVVITGSGVVVITGSEVVVIAGGEVIVVARADDGLELKMTGATREQ